jgi:hypothetical protein
MSRHLRACFVLVATAACEEPVVPPPVDSTDVRAEEIVARFELADAGDGAVEAIAIVHVGGPAHRDRLHYEPRAHVRVTGEDALWVASDRGDPVALEVVDDPEFENKFHYHEFADGGSR